MTRLDHIAIPVSDWRASRDWYREKLDLEVEFELADRGTAAMRDSSDLTLFLTQTGDAPAPQGLAFWIQIDSVDRKWGELSERGVAFEHPPQKNYWGYGATLLDPDGYRLHLWDRQSMDTSNATQFA